MKKTTKTLLAIIIAISTLLSCSKKEKQVTVSNVEISGTLKKFLKVADGTYKFTNNGDDAFITVEFELVEKPSIELCRKKHPEDIRINAIDKDKNIFDTGAYGFEPNTDEMNKLKDLLNSGKKGDKKSIAFKWDYYGVSKEEGKTIFEKAISFEVIDNTFDECLKITKDDIHWDDENKAKENFVKSTSTGGHDWDELLVSYENYIDQYITYMKKAKDGDMEALAEYTEYMDKAKDLQEKMSNAKSKLTSKQLAKYMKLQTKFANSISHL